MKTHIAFIIAASLPTIAANEQYVVFTEQDTSNDPPSRALAASVLQHSLGSETSSLGRYAWLFGGLDASMVARNDLWSLNVQTGAWSSRPADGDAPAARYGASMVLVGRCDHLPYTGRRTAHTRCRTCGNSE